MGEKIQIHIMYNAGEKISEYSPITKRTICLDIDNVLSMEMTADQFNNTRKIGYWIDLITPSETICVGEEDYFKTQTLLKERWSEKEDDNSKSIDNPLYGIEL